MNSDRSKATKEETNKEQFFDLLKKSTQSIFEEEVEKKAHQTSGDYISKKTHQHKAVNASS